MADHPHDHDLPARDALDVTTLRALGARAAGHPLVESWAFAPTNASPRALELRLAADAYPTGVDAARLDVHWFRSGDYYVHYVETSGEGRYQCRWDRHPKSDAPRTHFHPPPDAGEAVASPLATHPLDVLFAVLDWVGERVESLHAGGG